MIISNLYHFERWEKVNGLWVNSHKSEKKNLVVTQGLNYWQTNFWKGSAYTAAFYIGLIDNASFSAIALTDTAAQINGTNGWLESSHYSETVRQTLTMGTATSGQLDNTLATAIFTCNSGFTLNGAFISTSNVKAGTSGNLIGAASAPSPIIYASGQQIRIVISSTISN
jgi:hypothetical protein